MQPAYMYCYAKQIRRPMQSTGSSRCSIQKSWRHHTAAYQKGCRGHARQCHKARAHTQTNKHTNTHKTACVVHTNVSAPFCSPNAATAELLLSLQATINKSSRAHQVLHKGRRKEEMQKMLAGKSEMMSLIYASNARIVKYVSMAPLQAYGINQTSAKPVKHKHHITCSHHTLHPEDMA
jgi:hypothetical protein